LGICLGFQLAVIEFAQNVLGWKDANSTELDPNCYTPVVILMPEQNLNLVRISYNFYFSLYYYYYLF